MDWVTFRTSFVKKIPSELLQVTVAAPRMQQKNPLTPNPSPRRLGEGSEDSDRLPVESNWTLHRPSFGFLGARDTARGQFGEAGEDGEGTVGELRDLFGQRVIFDPPLEVVPLLRAQVSAGIGFARREAEEAEDVLHPERDLDLPHGLAAGFQGELADEVCDLNGEPLAIHEA